MKRAKEHFPVITIFSFALLVRLLYNLIVARGYIVKEDAALYQHIAQNLLNEHCFCLYAFHPNVSRAPLWPFIMAIIYFFTGLQDLYARLFYCFLDAGTSVLIYLFAQDLFGKRIALLTGLLASIYTGLFIYTGWLYSETLYTFCLTAFTYSLYRLQRTPHPRLQKSHLLEQNTLLLIFRHWLQQVARRPWSVCAGILLAMAALTRPNGTILFGLLYAWAAIVILAKIVPWQAVVGSGLLIAIIATAIIAPWTYRNYTVTHAFVPVALGMGDLLLGAYNDTVLDDNPIGRGLWVSRDRFNPPLNSPAHDAYNYTSANDQEDTAHALYWIRTHLSAMPYLLGLHFINMWTPYTFEPSLPVIEFPNRPSSQFVWSMLLIMPFPIFLLAAFGLFVTWRQRRKQLVVVYLALAITLAQNLIFYGNMRFRAPIEPLLVLLAGGAIWWLTSNANSILRARHLPKTAS